MAAFRVGFKSLAGLCATRKEDHPNENPTYFFAKLLFVPSLILFVVFICLQYSLPELIIFSDKGLLPTILGVIATFMALALLVGHLKFAVKESDIKWKEIYLGRTVRPFLKRMHDRYIYIDVRITAV